MPAIVQLIDNKQNVKSDEVELTNHPTVAWWDQSGIAVARKRLQNGNAEMPLAQACDWFNLEASFAAIDKVTKEVEKREALHTLRVKAASLEDEKRQLAIVVKKGLESQVHILKVCPYCGADLDLSIAHADHIFPISKGGLSIKKNMVYVCASCNIAKGSLTLNQFIKKMGFDRERIERQLEVLRKDY